MKNDKDEKENTAVEAKQQQMENARKVLQERAEKINQKVKELEEAMIVSQNTLQLEFKI